MLGEVLSWVSVVVTFHSIMGVKLCRPKDLRAAVRLECNGNCLIRVEGSFRCVDKEKAPKLAVLLYFAGGAS
jgi:hypothetical protein